MSLRSSLSAQLSDSLCEHEKITLNEIIRRFAAKPFTQEELEAFGDSCQCGAELRFGLRELHLAGVIKAVTKTWGERLYYIPFADFVSMQHRLFRQGQPEQIQSSEISIWKEAKPGLVHDVFRTLSWMAKGQLPLTAKGAIHQRSLNKLLEVLHLTSEDLEGLSLRYPYQDVYPASVAVVCDMILSLGLASRDNESWQMSENALRLWLENSTEAMEERLLLEVLERYIPANPMLQHQASALLLPCYHLGKWYEVSQVREWLCQSGIPQEDKAITEESWIVKWMQAFAGFGWIELGYKHHNILCFRWVRKPNVPVTQENSNSETMSQNGKIYVQPNYEVLVPQDVSYLTRWELELCCEHVRTDRMTSYQLTRSSLEEAMRFGRTAPDIINFLREKSEVGLPDHVADSITQWVLGLGRTTIEEVMLLRCRDEETAELISQNSELTDSVQRIGSLDFIVREGKGMLQSINRVLKKLELAPLKDKPRGSSYPRLNFSQEQSEQTKSEPWIYLGIPINYYQPDSEVTTNFGLFPGLKETPEVWTRELRSYHPSTAHEILNTAIKWRAKVELCVKGQIESGLPLNITEGGDWVVMIAHPLDQGQKVVEYRPQDCQKLRILLPPIR